MDTGLYLSHATDLKIKSIEETDDGNVIIRTHSIIVDRGMISENWTELYFLIEYDLTHSEAIKCLSEYGYTEYALKDLSMFDFLKIIAVGRKVYKFIMTEAELGIKAIQRPLDLENYDDVNRIRRVYRKKTRKYEDMVTDVFLYQNFIEDDKDRFLRNKKKLEEYNILFKQLLDET